ncbi:MAG TPA: murein L,D-transpeptidase catalytic domain family protein, partial [Flavisolibacter sp.]|nr:murein L,D-transpeptidase catalytic domain family protein [Flavisolibacter sp.]
PVIPKKKEAEKKLAVKVKIQADQGKAFAHARKLSTQYAFLIDMSQPSGRYRFFVYDFSKDSIVERGLVAHGSCNTSYLASAQFSNTPESGCSSLGKYKVSYSYKGQFGKAYKLKGLDTTNSNAFKRFVVLHAYDCVPDKEVYPQPICNSLGCPMVSYDFLAKLSGYIDKSPKPILLWIYQ